MNKSFALQFEQMEKVEGKKTEAAIKVYFVDDKNNVISDEKVFLANKTTDIMADRTIDMRFLLKNLDYDRNKSYFLVMKNANDESDVGESIPFVIDILKFKMF
jgi:isochorismate synthase EntC